MKNDETTTKNEPETTKTKEFYRGGTQYYQLCISNSKVRLEAITFPQICNLLVTKTDKGELVYMNDTEKIAFKTYLDSDRQIISDDFVINYC